ncbi:hypothetical protein [Nocardioides lijunqiniae]|uniref:hypothetical protein n=1 Tax=Nocardioides lijunqiniae TaxID=2760832 RepID=UPI0018783857|nr:hypothetical protein [Nocardioides lijunqiniae]
MTDGDAVANYAAAALSELTAQKAMLDSITLSREFSLAPMREAQAQREAMRQAKAQREAMREAMFAPMREAKAQREAMMAPFRDAQTQRELMMAPIREAKAQREAMREAMLAPMREAKAQRDAMLKTLRAHREAMLAPMREAQAQREAMMAPFREAKAQRDAMLETLKAHRKEMLAPMRQAQAQRDAMIAPVRAAVEAQRQAFLQASPVDQEEFARTMLGPVSEAVSWQLDAVAAVAADSDQTADEAEVAGGAVRPTVGNDWALHVFADYTAVMVFLMLVGWWLSEATRHGNDLAEANGAEVFATLSGFLTLAWAIRNLILRAGDE